MTRLAEAEAETRAPDAAGSERVVTVRVADAEHALALEDVVEVVRMVAVTPIPDSPPWLLGAVDVRGDVVPVIDLRTRLGHPALEPHPGMVLVIAAAPDGPVALCADAAGALEEVVRAEARGANAGGPLVRAGGRLISLLDPAALSRGAHRLIGGQ